MRIAKKACVIFLAALVCVAILEIGLRAIGRWPTNMADGIADQYGDSFRLKKNVKKFMKFPAYSYTVYTNEYGFRDKAIGARDLKGKRFSVFLGASEVFGNGVEYEDTFVGVFAEEANKRGMSTLNIAVGGHYFLDQESLFRDFMESTNQKPSTVYLCVNALHIPKFDQRNKHLIVKSGYVLDRNGWRIDYLRLLAGNLSSAFCFFRDGIRKVQERYLKYEVNDKSPEFLQIYSKNSNIRRPERVKAFYEYLNGFELFCQQLAIDVVYVYLPLSDSFKLNEILKQIGADPDDYDTGFYEELMRSHCEKYNKKLVNLRPIIQRYYDEGKELRFKLDPHFNKYTNRVIGEYLIRELL